MRNLAMVTYLAFNLTFQMAMVSLFTVHLLAIHFYFIRAGFWQWKSMLSEGGSLKEFISATRKIHV